MDSENYSIPEETAEVVNEALDKGKRVFAVGTSTMKTLETLRHLRFVADDTFLYHQFPSFLLHGSAITNTRCFGR